MSILGTATTINILEIYNETLQILNTNPFHFITLSLLFLPPIISTVAATLFFTTTTTVLLLIIISTFFFTILPTVIATALITYSTSLTINNSNTSSPVLTFKSTLDSLRRSFLPLLSTFLQLTIIHLFFAHFINVLPLIIKTRSFLILMDHHPTISSAITALYSFLSNLTILYLVSVWGSSASISVLESKSGFDSLRESRSRWANTTFRVSSFVAVLVTGIMIGSVMYYCVVVVRDVKLETKWHFYVQACAYILALCLVLLQYVVFNTLLYFQSNVEGDPCPKMDSHRESSGGAGFSLFFLFLTMIGFLRLCIGFFVN